MKWWVLVCSLLVVAGALLRFGAPITPVTIGLVVGTAMVWWRIRARPLG